MDGHTDGRMEVQTNRRNDKKIHPHVLQDISPFGAAAQKEAGKTLTNGPIDGWTEGLK